MFFRQSLSFIYILSLLLCNTVQAVKFLDQDLPKDEFNFLATQFPHLVEKSHELPEQESQSLDKTIYLNSLRQICIAPVHHPLLFSNDVILAFRMQEAEFAIYDQWHAQNPAPSIFKDFLYSKKRNQQHKVIEDVALAAHQIDSILIREGTAPVLFLGRSPCFVQVAYEELCRSKYPDIDLEERLVHLSFSGSPDVVTSRPATSYQDKEGNILRNMVTHEQLSFYENYMTQKNLHKVQDKLYLVDTIGTGGSLNSFLRLLRHYYEIHLTKKMPEIHFLFLYPLTDNIAQKDPKATWTYDQASQTLTFESLPEFGIRPLAIRATPIHLFDRTIIQGLDNDNIQKYFTHGIEFPAQKWRDEFKTELDQGGEWHADAYKFLRPVLGALVRKNEDMLKARQQN